MKSNSGILSEEENDFWDLDYEEVMFRFHKKSGKIYRKFYGESEEPDPIPHTSSLFAQARGYGRKISSEEYNAPKRSEILNS